MAVIISGTDGITTPGLTNTGTETIVNLTTTGNTILGDASTDTLNVGNGGLVKDASGNVGIGTSSPNSKLEVTSRITASDGGGASRIALNIESNTSAQTYSGINSYNYGTSTARNLVLNESGGNVGVGTISPSKNLEVVGTIRVSRSAIPSTYIEFFGGSGTTDPYINVPSGFGIPFNINGSEKARFDTSGNLQLNAQRILIVGASGIPAPVSNGDGNVGTTATGGLNLIGKGSSTDILFLNKNGNTAGSVATGATTITTSSDERLKENLQPITGALDIVCQMRHETGNYKSDPDRTVAFLIAQDVDKLFPYAVEKANPDEWGVNYNWITPLHGAAITELTALVKEQQALIATLTDRITALEQK